MSVGLLQHSRYLPHHSSSIAERQLFLYSPVVYEECKTYSDETVVSLSLRSGDDLVIQSPSHEIESIETHAAPLVGGVRDQAALDQATLSDAATDHSLPADTQDPLERCVQ
jgi:hypothetical protein